MSHIVNQLSILGSLCVCINAINMICNLEHEAEDAPEEKSMTGMVLFRQCHIVQLLQTAPRVFTGVFLASIAW